MELEVQNLTKIIKGTVILQNIKLSLTGGNIYGLRGKNGSGKTMLLRALCGLIKPSEGKIIIDGLCLGKDIDFPPSAGVLIENPSFLSGYTGFQNLKMLGLLKGHFSDEDIRSMIDAVGLDAYDKRKYRKYSLGMKQRLGIACALMGSPDLILLDEPLNALNEKGVELVKTLLIHLRDQGKIIVVACHDAEELEYLSDVIFKLENGAVYLER